MVRAYPARNADSDRKERRADHSRITRCAVIVLDASIVVELLTNGVLANSLRREIAASGDSLIVPHLLDVEVMSALRSLVAGDRISPHRGEELIGILSALRAERCSHTPLLGRIWEL